MALKAVATVAGQQQELGSYALPQICELAVDLARLLDAHFQAPAPPPPNAGGASGSGEQRPSPAVAQLADLSQGPAQQYLDHPDVQQLLQAGSLDDALRTLREGGLAEQLYYEWCGAESDGDDLSDGDEGAAAAAALASISREPPMARAPSTGAAAGGMTPLAAAARQASAPSPSGRGIKSSTMWTQYPAGSGGYALALSTANFPARIVLPSRDPANVPLALLGHEFLQAVKQQPDEQRTKQADAVLLDGTLQDHIHFTHYHKSRGKPYYLTSIGPLFGRHKLMVGDILHFVPAGQATIRVTVWKGESEEARGVKEVLGFDDALHARKAADKLTRQQERQQQQGLKRAAFYSTAEAVDAALANPSKRSRPAWLPPAADGAPRPGSPRAAAAAAAAAPPAAAAAAPLQQQQAQAQQVKAEPVQQQQQQQQQGMQQQQQQAPSSVATGGRPAGGLAQALGLPLGLPPGVKALGVPPSAQPAPRLGSLKGTPHPGAPHQAVLQPPNPCPGHLSANQQQMQQMHQLAQQLEQQQAGQQQQRHAQAIQMWTQLRAQAISQLMEQQQPRGGTSGVHPGRPLLAQSRPMLVQSRPVGAGAAGTPAGTAPTPATRQLVSVALQQQQQMAAAASAAAAGSAAGRPPLVMRPMLIPSRPTLVQHTRPLLIQSQPVGMPALARPMGVGPGASQPQLVPVFPVGSVLPPGLRPLPVAVATSLPAGGGRGVRPLLRPAMPALPRPMLVRSQTVLPPQAPAAAAPPAAAAAAQKQLQRQPTAATVADSSPAVPHQQQQQQQQQVPQEGVAAAAGAVAAAAGGGKPEVVSQQPAGMPGGAPPAAAEGQHGGTVQPAGAAAAPAAAEVQPAGALQQAAARAAEEAVAEAKLSQGVIAALQRLQGVVARSSDALPGRLPSLSRGQKESALAELAALAARHEALLATMQQQQQAGAAPPPPQQQQ